MGRWLVATAEFEGVDEVSEDAEGLGDVAEELGVVAVVAGGGVGFEGVDNHHMGDGVVFGRVGLCDIGSGGDEDADDFGAQTGGGDEEDGNGVVVFGVGGGVLCGEDAPDFGKGGGGFFDFGDEGGVCGLGDEFGGGVESSAGVAGEFAGFGVGFAVVDIALFGAVAGPAADEISVVGGCGEGDGSARCDFAPGGDDGAGGSGGDFAIVGVGEDDGDDEVGRAELGDERRGMVGFQACHSGVAEDFGGFGVVGEGFRRVGGKGGFVDLDKAVERVIPSLVIPTPAPFSKRRRRLANPASSPKLLSSRPPMTSHSGKASELLW